MGKIIFKDEILFYFDELINTLFFEEYFSYAENAQEYVAKIDQKKKDEDLMRKFHVVTGIIKSFEKNFPIVWEDAKKKKLQLDNDGNDEVRMAPMMTIVRVVARH